MDRLERLGEHVCSTEGNIDGDAETVLIAEAPSGVLDLLDTDPLDTRADTFGAGVGDAMADGVDVAFEMAKELVAFSRKVRERSGRKLTAGVAAAGSARSS